jgi:hypothetical protein
MEYQEKKKKSILGGRSKRYRLDEIIDPLNDIKNIDLKLYGSNQLDDICRLCQIKMETKTEEKH